MLPSTRLHGPQHGAHDRTADADDGNHDNEPTDGDRLRHHYATAGLGLLLGRVVLSARGPAGPSSLSGGDLEGKPHASVVVVVWRRRR